MYVAIGLVVWLLSYVVLPKILSYLPSDSAIHSVNPIQRINFATINTVLLLVLIK